MSPSGTETVGTVSFDITLSSVLGTSTTPVLITVVANQPPYFDSSTLFSTTPQQFFYNYPKTITLPASHDTESDTITMTVTSTAANSPTITLTGTSSFTATF